jgi:hypothetical protein
MDDFLGGIRAEITEDLLPGAGFPVAQVFERIASSLLELIEDHLLLHSSPVLLIFGVILPKNRVGVHDYLLEKMHGAGGRVDGENTKEFITAEIVEYAEDFI